MVVLLLEITPNREDQHADGQNPAHGEGLIQLDRFLVDTDRTFILIYIKFEGQKDRDQHNGADNGEILQGNAVSGHKTPHPAERVPTRTSSRTSGCETTQSLSAGTAVSYRPRAAKLPNRRLSHVLRLRRIFHIGRLQLIVGRKSPKHPSRRPKPQSGSLDADHPALQQSNGRPFIIERDRLRSNDVQSRIRTCPVPFQFKGQRLLARIHSLSLLGLVLPREPAASKDCLPPAGKQSDTRLLISRRPSHRKRPAPAEPQPCAGPHRTMSAPASDQPSTRGCPR